MKLFTLRKIDDTLWMMIGRDTGETAGYIAKGQLGSLGVKRGSRWHVIGHEYVTFASLEAATLALYDYAFDVMQVHTAAHKLALADKVIAIVKRHSVIPESAKPLKREAMRSRFELHERIAYLKRGGNAALECYHAVTRKLKPRRTAHVTTSE